MIVYNQDSFNNFILDNKVVSISLSPWILSSGRPSHFYADWRPPSNRVRFVDEVTDNVISFVDQHGLKPDCYFGVAAGATKFSLFSQFKFAKSRPDYESRDYLLPMDREIEKDHGAVAARSFVGAPKGKTIIIEDGVTTAMSTLKKCAALRELGGVEVIAVITLTDRSQLTPIPGEEDGLVSAFSEVYEKVAGKKYQEATSVKKMFEGVGIPYYELSEASVFLPMLALRDRPNNDILGRLDEEFKHYGAVKLDLVGLVRAADKATERTKLFR